MNKLRASVLMRHEVGLHARPSVKLTKLAKAFESRIDLGLSPDGPWVDAKSIVKVMATRAPNRRRESTSRPRPSVPSASVMLSPGWRRRGIDRPPRRCRFGCLRI